MTSTSTTTRASSSSTRASSSSVPSSTRASSTSAGVSSTRTSSTASTTTKPPPVGSGTATWSGNPFSGVDLWANKYYSSEVHTLAIPKLSGAMATAAAKVAEVPSFMWL